MAVWYAGCEMSVILMQVKLLQCLEKVKVAAAETSLTHPFSWAYWFWGVSQLTLLCLFPE